MVINFLENLLLHLYLLKVQGIKMKSLNKSLFILVLIIAISSSIFASNKVAIDMELRSKHILDSLSFQSYFSRVELIVTDTYISQDNKLKAILALYGRGIFITSKTVDHSGLEEVIDVASLSYQVFSAYNINVAYRYRLVGNYTDELARYAIVAITSTIFENIKISAMSTWDGKQQILSIDGKKGRVSYKGDIQVNRGNIVYAGIATAYVSGIKLMGSYMGSVDNGMGIAGIAVCKKFGKTALAIGRTTSGNRGADLLFEKDVKDLPKLLGGNYKAQVANTTINFAMFKTKILKVNLIGLFSKGIDNKRFQVIAIKQLNKNYKARLILDNQNNTVNNQVNNTIEFTLYANY
jgi:hypothetical protein